MTWIVAGEVVKIHTYLLKAPRLRYMVGASRLLETFATRVVPALAGNCGGTAKLAAAGRFWVEFDDKDKGEDKAKNFGETIKALGLALFGGESLLVSGPHSKDATTLQEVADSLESQKLSVAVKTLDTLAGLQHLERCGACQSWGVLAERPRYDERLCSLCDLKLQARNQNPLTIMLPQRLAGDGLSGLKVGNYREAQVQDGYLEVPYADNPVGEDEELNDFHDIAGEAGDLGMFYADGNAMGEIFGAITDVDAFVTKSNDIQKWNDKALQAAAGLLGATFPGRVLARGGDDLLVVLPAREAVQFAQAYLEHISAVGAPFTRGVSAGLVISKPSLPFRLLLARAEELLKQAKKQVRLLHKANSDLFPDQLTALDFQVITSSLLEPVSSRAERQAYPFDYSTGATKVSVHGHAIFTARPYLVGEFSAMVEAIKSLKENWPEAPSRFFLALREIYRPRELRGKEHLDEQGHFKELSNLCHRYRVLHQNQRTQKAIDDFHKGNFLDPAEWAEVPDADGTLKSAIRLWHADVADLHDFIEEG